MMTYEVVFWFMLGVFGFSLVYPWHPNWPAARWLKHLTLLLFPLWYVYESSMPSHMNIRLDLPLIFFGVVVATAVYIFRLGLFSYIRITRREINQQNG